MAVWSRLPLVISALMLCAQSCHAVAIDRNTNVDDCVDPKGYSDCFRTQGDLFSQCVDECNTNDNEEGKDLCIEECQINQLAANVGCYIQSCWNKAYSCGYQEAVLDYVHYLETKFGKTPIAPFFPAPEEYLPRSCSCNLGYVYTNMTIEIGDDCTGVNDTPDCQCCLYSQGVSNILNTCPKTNLTSYGFPELLALTQSSINYRTANKCAILNASNDICLNTYNISHAGKKWKNPLGLPSDYSSGDMEPEDLPGIYLTAFGADTFVMTLEPDYTTTITPASYDESAASSISASVTGAKGSPLIMQTTTTTSRTTSTTTTTQTGETSTSTAGAAPVRTAGLQLGYVVAVVGLVLVGSH